MKEIWGRIENWLKVNYPEGLDKLNEGASDELIKSTEQFVGVNFPDDVKDFFKIHNGISEESYLIAGWYLLSVEDIKSEWKIWKDLLDEGAFQDFRCTPHEAIQNNWWNDKWIPLTWDGAGNNICLDFTPTEKGKIGQIIIIWHDDDVRPLVADSFREWLTDYVEALEAGEYVYSKDYEGIVSIDDI